MQAKNSRPIATAKDGRSLRRSRLGQSTVEYAVVLSAFLAVVLALGALWHAGRDGHLLALVVKAASHLLGGGDVLGSANDILLY